MTSTRPTSSRGWLSAPCIAALALATACGGKVAAGTTDGGASPLSSDGGIASTSATDAGPPDGSTTAAGATVTCGVTACAAGSVCCVTVADGGGLSETCRTSCIDGDTIACDGPEDCAGGGACCASIALGPGTAPTCSIDSVSAGCASSCPTALSTTCATTDRVQLCHTGADCTDGANGSCCAFGSTSTGATPTFCVSSLYATFATKCF